MKEKHSKKGNKMVSVLLFLSSLLCSHLKISNNKIWILKCLKSLLLLFSIFTSPSSSPSSSSPLSSFLLSDTFLLSLLIPHPLHLYGGVLEHQLVWVSDGGWGCGNALANTIVFSFSWSIVTSTHPWYINDETTLDSARKISRSLIWSFLSIVLRALSKLLS